MSLLITCVIKAVLCFSFILIQVHCTARKTFDNDILMEVIGKAQENFPDDFDSNSFVKVVQFIDKANNMSVYTFPSSSNSFKSPEFTNEGNDIKKNFVVILKPVDWLFSWENQTIIVLKKISTEIEGTYAVLQLYLRQIQGRLVFEWDIWREKKMSTSTCACSLYEKFFRPCFNWDYCNIISEAILNAANLTTESLLEFNSNEIEPLVNAMQHNDVPPGFVYSIGPFYSDIVDSSLKSGILNNLITSKREKLEKFDIMISSIDSLVPFVGFGDCSYVKHSYQRYMKNTNFHDVVEFFLSTLRAQCLEEEKQELSKVFEMELLVNEELTLTPNIHHPLMSKLIITEKEQLLLETMLFFAAYSKIYKEIMTDFAHSKYKSLYSNPVSPSGLRISLNTHLITILTLRVYDTVQKALEHHVVKITRTIASSLKNNLILRIREHADLTQRCPFSLLSECQEALTVNFNNRLQSLSLLYFILYKPDSDSNGDHTEDTFSRFKEFYVSRFNFINKQVIYYHA